MHGHARTYDADKIAPDPSTDPSSLIGTAIAQGFALAAVVYMSTAASAGHVNPAVTFGLAIGGHISLTTAMFYWISQLLASTAACIFLYTVTAGMAVPVTGIATEMTGFGGAVLEGVTTFGLVYTVYAAGDPRKYHHGVIGPIAVGLVLVANVLATGPFTGGSMNPARSFGPAVVSGNFKNHGVYWLGPLIGAGLAAIIYQNVVFPAPNLPEASVHGNVETIAI